MGPLYLPCYNEDMAIPTQHAIVVRAVENDFYPLLTTCSCQWQAHARTYEQAVMFARNHAGIQTYRGNDVATDIQVEAPIEQRSKRSVEAVEPEDTVQSESTPATEAGSGS